MVGDEPAKPSAFLVEPASTLQRAVALVVDFLFFWSIVLGLGLASNVASVPTYAGMAYLVAFLVWDLALTALWGLSVGRAVAGIRVIRLADGGAPGFARAAARIGLVLTTGVVALVYWTFAYEIAYQLGPRLGPFRLWWDSAIGTALVRSTRWGPPPALGHDELEGLRLTVFGKARGG